MILDEGHHLVQSEKMHALLCINMLDIPFAHLSAIGDPYLDDKGTVGFHSSSPSLAAVVGYSLTAGCVTALL